MIKTLSLLEIYRSLDLSITSFHEISFDVLSNSKEEDVITGLMVNNVESSDHSTKIKFPADLDLKLSFGILRLKRVKICSAGLMQKGKSVMVR